MMVKSLLSIAGSIVITVVLAFRVVNANSFDEVIVIGGLALFTGVVALYLLFTSFSKNAKLSYGKTSIKKTVTHYYVTMIALLILMEIFLYFAPLDNQLLEIPKAILMLFFLVGIVVLSVLLYSQKKHPESHEK